MRRQKFKVILISNERSKYFLTQFVLTLTYDVVDLSGSNSSSIQLVHGLNWFQITDSEDLSENYPHSESLHFLFYLWSCAVRRPSGFGSWTDPLSSLMRWSFATDPHLYANDTQIYGFCLATQQGYWVSCRRASAMLHHGCSLTTLWGAVV